MARPRLRPEIIITQKEREKLIIISNSRTEELRRVQRAKIILLNLEGVSDLEISRKLNVNRKTVILCLQKCISRGVEGALNDIPRSGRPQDISDEEKAWIINIVCKKPLEFNFSYELWTYTLLLKYIHKAAKKKYPRLKKLSRSKLWGILNAMEIKPHKIKYYLEKRDEKFEEKMEQVLCVYKEVEIVNKAVSEGKIEKIDTITISYDEKPGIQAIGNSGKDLMPVPGKYNTIARDSEYKRHGTLSLLAGINLHSGEIIHTVSDTHKSSDFISFLKKIDSRYEKDRKIRVILDNHSAHISKETNKYLEGLPNRFEFVFTPKHGSWLNIIESFFSKMTRTFLRGIRVQSKKDLRKRINKYFRELNRCPVIFRWKYKMDEIHI